MSPRTALLVIDMQKDFDSIVTMSLPNVEKLISQFQTSSAPSIFVQHGHSKEELTANPSPNQLFRRWGPKESLAYGSDKWQIQDALQKYLPGRPIVHKNTYDSFINTNLQVLLEHDKIERVVVCGVQTECCCETTGRSAFNRGYETWMVSDACATYTEEQHKNALRGFGLAFGDVLTTSEAIGLLEKEE